MAAPKVRTSKKAILKNQSKAEGPSTITLTLKLEAAVKEDGDEWVAWCIPIEIFAQGKSKQESFALLQEAVHLWFQSCIERDVLDKALVESGFRKLAPKNRSSRRESRRDESRARKHGGIPIFV